MVASRLKIRSQLVGTTGPKKQDEVLKDWVSSPIFKAQAISKTKRDWKRLGLTRLNAKNTWGCYFTTKHNVDMAVRQRNGTSGYRTTPWLWKLSRVHIPIIFSLCMKNVRSTQENPIRARSYRAQHGQMAGQEQLGRAEETTPTVGQGNAPLPGLLQKRTGYVCSTKLQGLTRYE